MRKWIILIGIIACLPNLAQAQLSKREQMIHQKRVEKSRRTKKHVVSYDTLFNAGEAYCIFTVQQKVLGIITKGTAKELNGTEAFWINYREDSEYKGQPAYEITFVKSGQKAALFATLGTSIEKEIIAYELFKDGQFNDSALNRFLAMHPLPQVQPQISVDLKTDGDGSYPMVSRNRSGIVSIMAGEIKQSGRVIGYISSSSIASGGTIKKTIEITVPSGQLVARATAEGTTSHRWQVITSKDNTSHNVMSSIGQDDQDIVDYLVKRLYL